MLSFSPWSIESGDISYSSNLMDAMVQYKHSVLAGTT